MKYYSYEKKVRSRLEGQKEQQEERGRRRFGMKLPEVGRGCCLTTGRNTLASLVYRSSFPLILIAASWDREGKEETPSEMNGAGDQNGERIWMRSSQSGSACECRMAYLLGRKRAEGGKRSGKEKGKERKEKKRKDGVNAVSNERNKGPPAQQRTDGREGKRFPRGNVVTIIRQTSKSWAIRGGFSWTRSVGSLLFGKRRVRHAGEAVSSFPMVAEDVRKNFAGHRGSVVWYQTQLLLVALMYDVHHHTPQHRYT